LRIERQVDALFDALPERRGNATLALRLDQLSRWYPRPWMWILLGLVALVVRRPRGAATLIALVLAALAVVTLNALGLFADLHFLLPVAPAFVLFGLAAILGPRSRPRPS
jgi:CHASE2 domain-containing sensor protein